MSGYKAATAAPAEDPRLAAQEAAPARVESVSPYQAPQVSSPAEAGGVGAPVANYLWQSIVVTLLCCQPFGIPGIVFAARVDAYLAAGMQAEAVDVSQKAKMWTWIGFGCGLAVWLLYGIYMAVIFSGAAMNM